MLQAIAIIIVLIVVYYAINKQSETRVDKVEVPFATISNKAIAVEAPLMNREKMSAYAKRAEHMFEREQDCTTCTDGGGYEQNPYGAPDANYQDWIMAQGVDQAQIDNQKTFVNERMKQGALTGRTFTPDFHTSYDPISWAGLRRPQRVPIDEVTARQLPDVDYTLYESCNSLRWGC